jgi:hypothetical protein
MRRTGNSSIFLVCLRKNGDAELENGALMLLPVALSRSHPKAPGCLLKLLSATCSGVGRRRGDLAQFRRSRLTNASLGSLPHCLGWLAMVVFLRIDRVLVL